MGNSNSKAGGSRGLGLVKEGEMRLARWTRTQGTGLRDLFILRRSDLI